MIELTKKQFDYFINRIRLSHYDFETLTPTQIMERIVIAKYHLQIGVSNLIVNSDYGLKTAVYLCHPDNFTFNDVAQYNDFIYMDVVSAGFTWNSNGQLYFTPSASLYTGTNGYFDGIIVYFDGNLGHSGYPVFDFTGTNIKSIDYVGNNWAQINFNGNTPYLEEVNLSNDFNSLEVKYGEYDSNSSLPPSFFNGNNVKEISFAPKAFAGSTIKKMVLPETEEDYTIPESCFEGCTQLLEVVIPESVTAIGKNAFKKCTNLQYVYIPSTVTSIGDDAFEKCDSGSIKYEVDPTNPYFLGLQGALLRKKANKTYTIISGSIDAFANNDFDTLPYVDSSDWPSYYTPSTMPISTGMIKKTGGSMTVYDIHGNVITTTGLAITISNASTRRSQDGYAGNNYVLPVTYFITEIESRAFVDGNGIGFDCSSISGEGTFYLPSLDTIGNEAFKGCPTLQFGMPLAAGDNNEWNVMKYEFATTMTIGNSAFEGCNAIDNIYINKPTTFGTKAFFNCNGLGSIDFGDYQPVNVTSEIGQLCFGNTPNLHTITANITIPQTIDYTNTVRFNAIVNQDSSNNYANRGIYVGCKNTTIEDWMSQDCYKVLDYAFYGCTGFTVDSIYNNIPTVGRLNDIGNYAFYGCTGIVSTVNNPMPIQPRCDIGNSAFFGCTGISYLKTELFGQYTQDKHISFGEKSFANTNISEIYFDFNYIPQMAETTFDNCPLQTVNIDANGSTNTIVLGSTDRVANAVMTYINSGNITLVKSGDGKEIVNTEWTATTDDKNIVRICDNAFASSNMNSGNNRTIHIPQTVQYVGKTILKGSKTNNLIEGDNNKPCDLQLDGVVYSSSVTGICNNPVVDSIGLLFYVGGRYFQKIVEDTATLKLQNKHHYTVDVDNVNNKLLIKEGKNDILIAEIYYGNNHDIVLKMYYRLDYDYMSSDTQSHITQLDTPKQFILMHGGETFSAAEESIYCNPATAPGLTWQGISIPNDISTMTKELTYGAYTTISDGAFSDCKWAHNVNSRRLLTNTTNIFKGCTNLETIGSMDNDSNSINVPIFEGSIPIGAFDGCTNFHNFEVKGDKMHYPIVFNPNAFKDCVSFTPVDEMLELGVNFAESSFENTRASNFNLYSVCSLDPKAFKGNNRTFTKADSICGYYFTGNDGASIVNSDNVIVLGSNNSDINNSNGVGPFSFYGLRINKSITTRGLIDFSIGEEAFSTSYINSYTEQSCNGTTVGKGAFKKCNYLSEVVFGEGVSLMESAFEGCVTLQVVTLTRCDIPKNAFNGCVSLPAIRITGSVGENAFNGCQILQEVNFGYTLGAHDLTINPSAFIGCPISTINWANDTNDYWYENGCIYTRDEDGHIKVLIGTNAFTVDNINTKIIGEHAFDGRGLGTGIGTTTKEIVIPGGVTRIEDYAFANNPYLAKVYIPATVEYIGKGAFDGCTSLVRMTLPDSCEYVGEGAFKGCPLTEGFNCNSTDSRYTTNHSISSAGITGSNSYTKFKSSLDLRNIQWANSINAMAFSNTQIKSIWLPEKCSSVGNSAFYNCLYLVELHISCTAQSSFDDLSFYGCSNLGEIYLHHKVVPAVQNNQNVFYNVGAYVDANHRHLHVVTGFENNPLLTTSVFYKKLVTDCGFTVIGDLDE